MSATTQYAHRNGVHIAYQVIGEGDRDLVYLPGLWSHAEHVWRDPSFAPRGVATVQRELSVPLVLGHGPTDH